MARAGLERRLAKLEQRSDNKRRGGVIHTPWDATPERVRDFIAHIKRQLEGKDVHGSYIVLPQMCPPEHWHEVVAKQLPYISRHLNPFIPGVDRGEF